MKVTGRIGDLTVAINLDKILKVMSKILKKAQERNLLKTVNTFEVFTIIIGTVKEVLESTETDVVAQIRNEIRQGKLSSAGEQIVKRILAWIAYADLTLAIELQKLLDELTLEDPEVSRNIDEIVEIVEKGEKAPEGLIFSLAKNVRVITGRPST